MYQSKCSETCIIIVNQTCACYFINFLTYFESTECIQFFFSLYRGSCQQDVTLCWPCLVEMQMLYTCVLLLTNFDLLVVAVACAVSGAVMQHFACDFVTYVGAGVGDC